MEPADLLRHVSDLCDRLQITYLVTGSTATIAYGEPRLTNDIDIVVDLPADKVDAFYASFPAEQFYISMPAVAEAVRARHQFNVLHPASGLKIDFIVMTESDFDQSRRQRCRPLAVLPDRTVSFASPEDVIVKKWCTLSKAARKNTSATLPGFCASRMPPSIATTSAFGPQSSGCQTSGDKSRNGKQRHDHRHHDRELQGHQRPGAPGAEADHPAVRPEQRRQEQPAARPGLRS